MAQIPVINPNSSKVVTRSMEACLRLFEGNGHEIRCTELEGAPVGIETDAHVAEVVPMLIEAVQAAKADAIVIACFSDPGIAAVRAATNVPVVGIAEAAYLTALGLGRGFGIVSMGPSSIDRHRRYLEDLQLDGRLAGDRSLPNSSPRMRSFLSHALPPCFAMKTVLKQSSSAAPASGPTGRLCRRNWAYPSSTRFRPASRLPACRLNSAIAGGRFEH